MGGDMYAAWTSACETDLVFAISTNDAPRKTARAGKACIEDKFGLLRDDSITEEDLVAKMAICRSHIQDTSTAMKK
jgi:ketosteroid isomerase-like protein